jgi:hypothetical protein
VSKPFTTAPFGLRLKAPLLLVTILVTGMFAAAQADLSAYAVQPGYALEVDVDGFVMPTSIAFVPSPGDTPDAPLYYVAELQGTIKVVTVDRSVHVFARVPASRGQTPELAGSSQSGLAGICIDAEHGYLFATYTEADAGGVLRNRIVRFTSTPGTFGLRSTAIDPVDAMLLPFQSAPAHQIGTCAVKDGQVYVGVGDGGNFNEAANVGTLLGKVLCIDAQGQPCPDNPFLDAAAVRPDGSFPPEAYVHAYGFRNPFGLVWVGEQLYAAENGIDLDRFLPVRRGEDHLWRGTDQSLTVRADLVFVPTISPVQTGYLPTGVDFSGDDWRDRFVSAVFGGKGTAAGVIGYSGVTPGRGPDVPRYLLEYVGERGTQHFSALALGPDGVYTAPMVPGADGTSPVLRVRLDPTTSHPVHVMPRATLESMTELGVLATQGCVSCHAIEGKGGGIGPSLDRFGLNWRLTQRLNSQAYEQQVARVDALDEEPFRSWRAARQEVLGAHGAERTWTWLKHYLQEPRFDRPDNQMPNLGLSEAEAEALRTQLYRAVSLQVPGSAGRGLWERGVAYLRSNVRAVAAGAVGGAGLMVILGLLLAIVVRRRRRSRQV